MFSVHSKQGWKQGGTPEHHPVSHATDWRNRQHGSDVETRHNVQILTAVIVAQDHQFCHDRYCLVDIAQQLCAAVKLHAVRSEQYEAYAGGVALLSVTRLDE